MRFWPVFFWFCKTNQKGEKYPGNAVQVKQEKIILQIELAWMLGLWAFVCPNESQLTPEDVLKSDIFEIRNSIFHLVELRQIRVYLLVYIYICKMFHEGVNRNKTWHHLLHGSVKEHVQFARQWLQFYFEPWLND